jgi:hypothetical protein
MDKFRAFFAPNRVVGYLTAGAGAATAAVAVLENTDGTTTAGLVAGYAGAVAAAIKWLDGWQKHEAREHEALQGVETAELPPKQRTDVPADQALVG